MERFLQFRTRNNQFLNLDIAKMYTIVAGFKISFGLLYKRHLAYLINQNICIAARSVHMKSLGVICQ